MRRRGFLEVLAQAVLAGAAGPISPRLAATGAGLAAPTAKPADDVATLFLCGDVMLGRGIDQILPHPSDPVLYESYVEDARGYVALAERRNGPIPRGVAWDYVWGDALAELDRRRPDARIINLETAVTAHAAPWPGKGIHYRMHPANRRCLEAAGIDCCVLANNHVLDWSRPGLAETLATLSGAGRNATIAIAGAGTDLTAAQAPAVLPLAGGGRVLVFAAATGDSGVPSAWAATASQSGVWLLPDLSVATLRRMVGHIDKHRRAGDIVVFSVHWGDNWGYEIPPEQRAFARGLIDDAGVDVVHGHSSHHPRALEVHGGRLVLYGCGDFLSDYEGIEGHEQYRGELGLMYFPQIERGSGRLLALDLVPTRVRNFRVTRAGEDDRGWMLARLRRELRRFGGDIELAGEGAFALRW